MIRQTLLYWAPAVVAPALIASGVAIAGTSSPAALPHKTPQQVIQLAEHSAVGAFSGIVESDVQLGLPDLSALGGASASPSATPGASATDIRSVLGMLTGKHTARVYVDGRTKQRVQVMDTLAERDIVRNGNSVWLYDSAKQSAVHLTAPKAAKRPTAQPGGPRTPGDFENPSTVAKGLLAGLKNDTRVSLGHGIPVAGHSAYDLVLTPRTGGSLIGSISIAVDGTTGLPLQVQVRARGAHDPALSIRFTRIDLSAPSADLFAFSPPKGTSVTSRDLSASHAPKPSRATGHLPSVTGTGWDAVVELPAGTVPAATVRQLGSGVMSELTKPVAGGRLLSTSLVNVLVTDDGRVYAGAVPAGRLISAATGSASAG